MWKVGRDGLSGALAKPSEVCFNPGYGLAGATGWARAIRSGPLATVLINPVMFGTAMHDEARFALLLGR